MDYTSDSLFDNTIHSNILDMDLGQECLELAYDDQLFCDRYNHDIAPFDLDSLKSLDLIASHPGFGSPNSQAQLEVPALDNKLASLPSQQAGTAPRIALKRSNSNVSRGPSTARDGEETAGPLGRISTAACEAESRLGDSGTNAPKEKRRKRRKGKLTPAEEEAKHRNFLERNRLAASRCRQKKKKQFGHLEEKKLTLEAENNLLKLQLEEAKDEVTILQNFVMMHASCDDLTPSNCIENEAIRNAIYPASTIDLLNPISPAAELDTGRSGTGIPSKKESTISRCASMALIEQDSPASSSNASSPMAFLKFAEQPSAKLRELWSPVDSGVEI